MNQFPDVRRNSRQCETSRFRLPSDVPASEWFVLGEQLDVRAFQPVDFQMHTTWTDGSSSVFEMIQAAKAKGLRAIAITEHVNEQSRWYPEFVSEVKDARRTEAGIAIYFGAEIAAADFKGNLKVNPATLEAELLLGVVHRYPRRDGSGFWAFDQLTLADAVELELKALTALTSNSHIHVLGHPGGTTYKKFGAFPVEWLEPVFCAAREAGIAVELNTKYLWDANGMLALLQRVNPLVSFGSDAHHAREIGLNCSFMKSARPLPTLYPTVL